MIIVKVKHETGLDANFLDITVSDDRLHLLFVIKMLENNDSVVWYEILHSTMTSFDIITNVKDEFNFPQAYFTKLKQKCS